MKFLNYYLTRLLIACVILTSASQLLQAQSTKFSLVTPSGASAEYAYIYRDIIRKFNNIYPNIKINLVSLNDWDDVVVAANSNQYGDGVYIGSMRHTQEMASSGSAAPLNNIISYSYGSAAQFEKNFVHQLSLENSKYKNEIYGIPICLSTPLLFLNFTELTKCTDISINNLPNTYEDLEKVLSDYQRCKPKNQPMLIDGGRYDWVFENMVAQLNGPLLLDEIGNVHFKNKAVFEVLKTWKSFSDKKLVRLSISSKSALNRFTYGQVPVIAYPSSGYGTIAKRANFDYHIMPLPGSNNLSLDGASVHLTTGLDQQQAEAAWLFIRYLLRPETQAFLAINSGYAPTVLNTYKEPSFIAAQRDPSYKNCVRMALQAKQGVTLPNQTNWQTYLRQAIQAIITAPSLEYGLAILGNSWNDAFFSAQSDKTKKKSAYQYIKGGNEFH